MLMGTRKLYLQTCSLREEVTYKFGAARRELWTCLIP